MKTDFLGPAYKSRSLPLACQTAINLIFEPTPTGGMYYVSPGRKPFLDLVTGPSRGGKMVNGYDWVVAGSTLYRVNESAAATVIGTVPGTGRVEMVANESQLIVMHSEGWHVVTLETLAYAAVPDSPTTAQGAYLGGRVYFPNVDGTYGWTELNTASALDSLSFASAETLPDKIIAMVEDHGEMVALGETTTEFFQESGDPELPLARMRATEYGIIAKHSVAKSDLTIFWLGRNEDGDPRVYRREGYSPVGISDFAIDTYLASCDNLADAFAFCFSQEGHTYYWLTIPGKKTFVFDASTQRWAERAHRNVETGELEPHRAAMHLVLGGKHIVGDTDSGMLYEYSQTTYTDNGDPLYWERTFPGPYNENLWVRYNEAELVAEMGVGLDEAAPLGSDPYATLSWSDNGGRLFVGHRNLPLGKLGEYNNRARRMRLGIGRRRIFRVSGSAPVKTVLYEFSIKAEPLSR